MNHVVQAASQAMLEQGWVLSCSYWLPASPSTSLARPGLITPHHILAHAGVSANNPSQDLDTLASRLRNSGPRTVIAVAPALEQGRGGKDVVSDDMMPSSRGFSSRNSGEGGSGEANSGSANGGGNGAGAEMLAAEEFSSWLVDELGGDEG